MKKNISYMGIVVLLVIVVIIFYMFMGKTTNEQEVKVTPLQTIEFTENATTMDVDSAIFEKYKGKNLRIVGAIVQEVTSEYINIKTYRAGPGTTSIVEEKKIFVTVNTPVFETKMSFSGNEENKPVRKTISSIKKGDHIIVDCADSKDDKGNSVYTALSISKDVMDDMEMSPEDEL